MKAKALLLIATIISLTACAIKDADQTAMFFYDMVKNGDFETAVTVIDPEALKHTPKQAWIDGLTQKQNQMGVLLSYKRIDFYTDTIDNITRVTIDYEVKYSNGILKEKLHFICRNQKYFVTFYEFNESE